MKRFSNPYFMVVHKLLCQFPVPGESDLPTCWGFTSLRVYKTLINAWGCNSPTELLAWELLPIDSLLWQTDSTCTKRTDAPLTNKYGWWSPQSSSCSISGILKKPGTVTWHLSSGLSCSHGHFFVFLERKEMTVWVHQMYCRKLL